MDLQRRRGGPRGLATCHPRTNEDFVRDGKESGSRKRSLPNGRMFSGPKFAGAALKHGGWRCTTKKKTVFSHTTCGASRRRLRYVRLYTMCSSFVCALSFTCLAEQEWPNVVTEFVSVRNALHFAQTVSRCPTLNLSIMNSSSETLRLPGGSRSWKPATVSQSSDLLRHRVGA